MSERHLKFSAAQTGRSWLQQNARVLTSATRNLIAASYPPCVTFHFPWHKSTDAASSIAVGQLYRPVSVHSCYTSPDSNVGSSHEHLRVARVSSLAFAAASFSQSARLTSSEAQSSAVLVLS